jgi:hypothetical protein
MNVTSALNAIRKLATTNCVCFVAVRNSSKWSNFGRYTAAMLIGSLATSIHLLQPSPAPVSNDQELYRIIGHYRNQIDRDDFVLNHFMGNTWDRSCIYDRVPQVKLADGSMRFTLFQICEEKP